MARINFGRVEERLTSGLRKMFVKKLQERAVAQAPVTPKEKQSGGITASEAGSQMLEAVHADLKRMTKRSKDVHKRLGISEQELGHLVDDPAELSLEDWKQLADLKEKIEKESQKFREQFEDEEADARLVEEERLLHKYKRFNVRKGWVPLDTHAPPPRKRRRQPGSWEEED